ncbi:MAG: hypothetical protein OEV44_08550 [Spirochaetota bacterium]|nr:hypothetical protein [Spirochaetota bacterium]
MKSNSIQYKNNINYKIKQNNQLILFNRKELQIINRLMPTRKTIENIKRLKHVFNGELIK